MNDSEPDVVPKEDESEDDLVPQDDDVSSEDEDDR